MATKQKHALNKAFIDIGKVPVLQTDGTTKPEQEYVVVPEDLAKYIGATYTTTPPKPKEITKKGGGKYTREVSVTVIGKKYKIGYVDGTTGKGKARKVKFKWVTIHIPNGARLRTYINALMGKLKKKPVLLKTPAGKTTRLFDTK
jgi:hypothetical protein